MLQVVKVVFVLVHKIRKVNEIRLSIACVQKSHWLTDFFPSRLDFENDAPDLGIEIIFNVVVGPMERE